MKTTRTSGPSAGEPLTRHQFPGTGVAAIVATVALVAVLSAVAIGIVVSAM